MNKSVTGILFFVGLIFPVFIIFRVFFGDAPLVWGDAPYFYPEGLKSLLAEPYIWVNRGYNFGWVNDKLWLYPLMLFYGALYKFFALENDQIVRIIFYFPAVILSLLGPVIFVRYIGYSPIVQFFSALFYTFNTYFLLVIDGGQVGVALAYGLFPITLLYLMKLWEKSNFWNFWRALLFLFLLLIFDVRVAAISVVTLFLFQGLRFLSGQKIPFLTIAKYFIPLFLAALFFTFYWFFPTLKLGFSSIELSSTTPLALISLLDTLYLFQPHWPENIFGKINSPPFYYAAIPILVFGSFLARRKKQSLILALLFLIFAFAAKGTGEPFGQIYDRLVSSFSFGFAFRDSTKFFIPLVLFGGILIGTTVDTLGNVFGKKRGVAFSLCVWIFLLALVHPAILGKLNGVLSGREKDTSFSILYTKFSQDVGFFRVVWFPDRHPFTFLLEEKPGLDAKRLVETRPIASLNVGTLDAFNFLHDDAFLDWFATFGIQYLVFSGNSRNPMPTFEDQEDWNNLLGLIEKVKGLEKMEWNTNFPIYRVSNTKPRIFAVDKVIAVIGGENIYEKIRREEPSFSVGNQGFVFFEDGKLDPQLLRGLERESAVLVFNEKEDIDLQMSFLKKYFVAPQDASKKEWKVWEQSEYLKWKYEFLTKKIDSKEFDYGRGIAISSVNGEEISWNLPVPKDGDYVLAARVLENQGFSWQTEILTLARGMYPLTLTNNKEFSAVNVVALIPKEDWDEAVDLVRQFTGHFKVFRTTGVNDVSGLIDEIAENIWHEIEYEQQSPTRYKIHQPKRTTWIVLSENYHPLWQMETGPDLRASVPFYSVINGFYLKPDWRDPYLVFEGQKYVRWGIYYTLLVLFSLAIAFFWFYPKGSK